MKIVDAELPELKREGHHNNLRESCFAHLAEAVALKERDNMPMTGLSRDRRVLNHIDEVCVEPNLQTLMCLICSSKHFYYHGCDKFGKEYNAGRIDDRVSKDEKAKLREIIGAGTKTGSFFDQNLRYNDQIAMP